MRRNKFVFECGWDKEINFTLLQVILFGQRYVFSGWIIFEIQIAKFCVNLYLEEV